MDLSALTPVLTAAGPFTTVLLDVTHTDESARTELELRVRAATEQLADLAPPAGVVDAVRERLLADDGSHTGRALVAAGDGSVVVDVPLTGAPVSDVVDLAPLPDLLPVLRQLPGRVPHVVVVVDRLGADVVVAGGTGGDRAEESVDGDAQYVHKVKTGGIGDLSVQHSTEDVWRANAKDVAERVGQVAERTGARFVLVAGDPRARPLVVDQLPVGVRDLVVTTDEGGRGAGADRSGVERRAAELVAEHEARQAAAVREQLDAAGAHGLAVQGVGPVVDALRKGQVETLVLSDDPGDDELVTGADPTAIGATAEELRGLGVADGVTSPADRVLLRAALATDADVVVLPAAAMPAGVDVGAVLRYADASTTDRP
ncbi:baeRF2 domain-containing protein [Klenkia brasiliensis]|uniref:Peptide chain release factor 1 (ERF1) n=1 Tax=Klenkia brasiliensis TaxID=333142 RepID=A0A1G7UZW0_9ACTN|nr:hypothetical protein [Klenkia brasiliensis]SDG52791.1 hypothetical protein SAMN05660324_2839 [Klenkia brasiliensis]